MNKGKPRLHKSNENKKKYDPTKQFKGAHVTKYVELGVSSSILKASGTNRDRELV